jgi:hypothetical protein
MTAPTFAAQVLATPEAPYCGSMALDGTLCSTGLPIEPWIGGCVHEHIRTGHLCTQHRSELAAGKLWCAPCFDSSESHRCTLKGRQGR